MKASAAVLRADKELMVFPILSSIGVSIVTATFALPMVAARFFDNLAAGNSQFVAYIVLFFFYVVQYTVFISLTVGRKILRTVASVRRSRLF